MQTEPNTVNAVRMDLQEVYSTLERYTALRARMMILRNQEEAEAIIITESDYQTVNPFIRSAMDEIADQIGALVSFKHDGLDALTEWGLEDWKIKISGMGKDGEEGAEDLQHIIALYNLPGTAMDSGYRPAVHGFVYEAIVNHVLKSWFSHMGMQDVANVYLYEYGIKVNQARNAGPLWNSRKGQRRRPVNL